ncbi:hypothetical protein PMIN01_07619 [Paraphaeosphaeria minitans]|uniref:Uncharacterized protein n=1 Tax=Paraphaeosphaeria minitans TaxID=565426 RepID=A0A9P6GGG7_9PLEO|nr:hypothetical protein PMIN01_07619 [Paraphaeosphaeria minitans]
MTGCQLSMCILVGRECYAIQRTGRNNIKQCHRRSRERGSMPLSTAVSMIGRTEANGPPGAGIGGTFDRLGKAKRFQRTGCYHRPCMPKQSRDSAPIAGTDGAEPLPLTGWECRHGMRGRSQPFVAAQTSGPSLATTTDNPSAL